MKVAGGGFEQCYNAQAVVDTESMLVLAPHVTQAGNDKEQVEPMVEKHQALPEGLNQPSACWPTPASYSEKNVGSSATAGDIEPLIAVKRDAHHPHWRERFEEPAPLDRAGQPRRADAHALKTKAGRAAYALRKQTVEPVFGIIKSVMGFRQFLLRGPGQRPPRMDAGLPRVEFEAHGRIASAVAKQDRSIATSWPNDSISAQHHMSALRQKGAGLASRNLQAD
jgi:hypothetical protein